MTSYDTVFGIATYLNSVEDFETLLKHRRFGFQSGEMLEEYCLYRKWILTYDGGLNKIINLPIHFDDDIISMNDISDMLFDEYITSFSAVIDNELISYIERNKKCQKIYPTKAKKN